MGVTSGRAAAVPGAAPGETATTKLRPPGAPAALLRRERGACSWREVAPLSA